LYLSTEQQGQVGVGEFIPQLSHSNGPLCSQYKCPGTVIGCVVGQWSWVTLFSLVCFSASSRLVVNAQSLRVLSIIPTDDNIVFKSLITETEVLPIIPLTIVANA
jgi:hypothetical protein